MSNGKQQLDLPGGSLVMTFITRGIFASTEKLRLDFLKLKDVKFHVYILNIKNTISVELFTL